MKRRSWVALAQVMPAAPAAAPQGPELRDIHLPPDPSWFPPAPGWWILAALLIALLMWLFRIARKRMRKRMRKRRWLAALEAEVARISDDHATHNDPRQTTAAVSQLLRRAAVRLDSRAAAYQGDEWLAWLDSRGNTNDFLTGPGNVLVDAPWRRAPQVDADGLLKATRNWLAHAFAQEQPHV